MPRDVSLSDSKCWNGGHECANCTHRTVDLGQTPEPDVPLESVGQLDRIDVGAFVHVELRLVLL